MADSYLLNGQKVSGFSRNAKDIGFDPTGTDLQSTDVDGAIKEINSNLSVGTSSLTDKKSTVNTSYLSKENHDVFLQVELLGEDSTSLVTIAKIPDGYRPKKRLSGVCTVVLAANGLYLGLGEYAIRTAGVISFRCLGTFTGQTFCIIDTCYFT